jgi:hypothetical protein
VTVHEKRPLLTDRHRPLLCKAGVEGSSPFVSTKLATPIGEGHNGHRDLFVFSALAGWSEGAKGSGAVERRSDTVCAVAGREDERSGIRRRVPNGQVPVRLKLSHEEVQD